MSEDAEDKKSLRAKVIIGISGVIVTAMIGFGSKVLMSSPAPNNAAILIQKVNDRSLVNETNIIHFLGGLEENNQNTRDNKILISRLLLSLGVDTTLSRKRVFIVGGIAQR